MITLKRRTSSPDPNFQMIPKRSVEIFLDSGAYSAWTQKTTIEIDEYIEYIKQHPEVDVYCTLDVLVDQGDNSGGQRTFDNYRYMVNKGLNPLPVWHSNDDVKYLKYYLKRCDYIAIGAVSTMSGNDNMYHLVNRIFRDYLIDKDGMPIIKVHGFGVTSWKILRSFPWYSVDSTSWVMFSRYGIILVPKWRQVNGKSVWDYSVNPWKVCVSRRSPTKTGPKSAEYNHPSNTENFHNWAPLFQDKVVEYLGERGFVMGESEAFKGKTKSGKDKWIEEVTVPGVSNSTKMRDQINLLYYLELEKSIPEWPWPLKGPELLRIPI